MTDGSPPLRDRPGRLLLQFVVFAAVVLVLGMAGTGIWIGAQIERIVTANAGATTALYVDSMVSPVVQDLDGGPDLTEASRADLKRVLEQGALSHEISAFKLWDPNGRILFSTQPELVGRVSTDNPRLATALSGKVFAHLRDLTGAEPEARHSGRPTRLMEVYAPVRSTRTGQVIGVAEFYSLTERLREDLVRSRINSWVVVGGVSLAMFVAMFTIFWRGDRLIRRQRRALDAQITELSTLLAANEALGRRADQANQRITEINERTLRRLSADLHDGPAQLLAFAALRLDRAPGYEQVADAVNEALKELRFLCRGLVLPELEGWTVETIARRLIATHEARMGAPVDLRIDAGFPEASLGVKICIYRFLQETLANSARHAGGAGQSVVLRRSGPGIEVEVSDTGTGFDPDAETAGLGIAGLRERMAALKGRFVLHSAPGQGTCVTMWLPLAQGEDRR